MTVSPFVWKSLPPRMITWLLTCDASRLGGAISATGAGEIVTGGGWICRETNLIVGIW